MGRSCKVHWPIQTSTGPTSGLGGLVIQGIDSIQGELIEVGNLARRYKGLMTSDYRTRCNRCKEVDVTYCNQRCQSQCHVTRVTPVSRVISVICFRRLKGPLQSRDRRVIRILVTVPNP